MIEEEMTARLLRLAGMRPDVPRDRENRVKQAFFDEVRATARARAVRRRVLSAVAVLPIAAAVMLAIRLSKSEVAPPTAAEVVATVERMEGSGVLERGSSAPLGIALGDEVRVGDRIEASATGRVGLRLANGASLRFDRGSLVQMVSASRIALDNGAVYIDSGSESPGLEIVTSLGIVKDIGTQFEIRLVDASLRVRVRSGVVEVHRGTEISSARPGTELTVTAGETKTQSVEPYGDAWAWTANLAPVFEIEGRALSAFLEHVCREQGWTLVYADPKLGLEASGMILHGSTYGLPPRDALAIVLATTELTHRFEDGELHVARAVRP